MSERIPGELADLVRRLTDRRTMLKLAGSGLMAAPLALAGLGPRPAMAQEKVPFRVDENSSIHYMATRFTEQFLTKPIAWEYQRFGTSGQARQSAFIRGATDTFSTGWNYLVTSVARGLPTYCVSGIAAGGSRLLARRDSSIRTLADLKGKKVGVVQMTSQDIFLIYALKKIGIDAFKEVNRVHIGNVTGVVAAMQRGDVEACAIWEPFGSIVAIDQGARTIGDLAGDSFGRSHGGLFIRRQWVEQHPDLTQDIVNATIKASQYLESHRSEWTERATQITGQSKEVCAAAVANSWPDITIPMNTIRQIARALYELNIEREDVSGRMQQAITYEFLEKATGKKKEELGWST